MTHLVRRLRRVLVASLLLASCRGHAPDAGPSGASPDQPSPRTFTARPLAAASRGFWDRWGDGKAEVSVYRATVPRYGELWPAEVVLITVTETLDRRTLIKDDALTPEHRLPVIKLNTSVRFQTGFYPYAILTSVFMPADRYPSVHDDVRFAPVKLTLGAIEWCGHVYGAMYPEARALQFEGRSYFASEGNSAMRVPTPEGTIYEDALAVELRELDGAFAHGGDWQGALVPALWRNRRAHEAIASVPARITRTRAEGVVRFRLVAGSYEREYEVEAGGDHKLLGWRTNDGEETRLSSSARVQYWEENHHGGEAARGPLGLDATTIPTPSTPPGTRAVGF